MTVIGDGMSFTPDDTIQAGGGGYTDIASLPSQIDGGAPPCAGPYFWVTELVGVVQSAPSPTNG